MIRKLLAVVLVLTPALSAQTPTQSHRDSTSLAILNLLTMPRPSVVLQGQIHRLGEPDGQVSPVTVTIEANNASSQIEETGIDSTQTKSTLFQGFRIYADGHSDTLNSTYLFLPQVDLADELTDPKIAVDAGKSGPGQVSIRVHSERARSSWGSRQNLRGRHNCSSNCGGAEHCEKWHLSLPARIAL